MTYLISYDLNKAGKNYDPLQQAIKDASDGTWCKPLSSVYIIRTALGAKAIYNRLAPHIDQNDELLVIEVTQNSHWYLDPQVGEYLKKML